MASMPETQKFTARNGVVIDLSKTAPKLLSTYNNCATDLWALEEDELLELGKQLGIEMVNARRRGIEATARPPAHE